MPEPREVGVAVAVLLLVLSITLAIVARHRPTVRTLALAFCLLAGLRVYSASSFLWAGDVPDVVLGLLRYIVLAVTTSALILAGSVLAYFIRLRDD